jgi:hypothetical protein
MSDNQRSETIQVAILNEHNADAGEDGGPLRKQTQRDARY